MFGGCRHPKRVKLRRTQYEHMFSVLPSNSGIARRSGHVSNVPIRKCRRCCEAASELSDVCKIRSTVGTSDLLMRRHAKVSRHAFLRGAFACPRLSLKNQFFQQPVCFQRTIRRASGANDDSYPPQGERKMKISSSLSCVSLLPYLCRSPPLRRRDEEQWLVWTN